MNNPLNRKDYLALIGRIIAGAVSGAVRALVSWLLAD
jgi:hypothetical protein